MTIFFLVFLIGDHLFEVIPYHIRGGSRGRVQGVCTPPLPEMTCGFLIQLVFCEKKKLCGLLVLKQSKRRVHPLLKKSWIRPCTLNWRFSNYFTLHGTITMTFKLGCSDNDFSNVRIKRKKTQVANLIGPLFLLQL